MMKKKMLVKGRLDIKMTSFFQTKKEKEFLKKHNDINTLTNKQILQDLKLGKITSKTAKELMELRYKLDTIKADDEYRKSVNKNTAHAVFDIATAAIPIGTGKIKAVSKIAEQGAKKLTPYLGKKISQATINNTIQGGATGAVHGTGSAIIDNKNPIPKQ